MSLHKQLDDLPVKYQDFVGFSFDHIHSSKLGILRTSEGDNYEESLLPDFEDSTSDVKGISGQYYFGQQHKAKHIKVSIGFDNMTELQFREFRRLLSVDRPCPLIFDERPYKTYMAKIESVPELSYTCFDEPKKTIGAERPGIRIINRDTTPEREPIYPYEYEYKDGQVVKQRIYKGTGTIEFICYYPYAKSTFKTLDEYESEESVPGGFTNVEEWQDSSGIMTLDYYDYYNIDRMVNINENSYINQIVLYNPGDLDAPFKLFIPYHFSSDSPSPGTCGTISPKNGESEIKISVNKAEDVTLKIKPITAKADFTKEKGIIINTYNHLIEGVQAGTNDYKTTGNTYNEFIIEGDFGKIDRSAFYPYNDLTQAIYTNIVVDANKPLQVIYDYLYY